MSYRTPMDQHENQETRNNHFLKNLQMHIKVVFSQEESGCVLGRSSVFSVRTTLRSLLRPICWSLTDIENMSDSDKVSFG